MFSRESAFSLFFYCYYYYLNVNVMKFRPFCKVLSIDLFTDTGVILN